MCQGNSHHARNAERTGELQPLTPTNPRWDLRRPNADKSGNPGSGERILIIVCMHGNEPCGMLAANELLREKFFEFSTSPAAWPAGIESITIMLGNPQATHAQRRFLDKNLNRIFTEEDLKAAAAPGGPPTVEHARVCELAEAIEDATQMIDIHSSSAESPPFAVHFPSPATSSYVASLPVAFAVEDNTLVGTSSDWARKKGIQKAAIVECGGHNARHSVDVARALFQRVLRGDHHQPHASIALQCPTSVMVGPGFRFATEVHAFQKVQHGDLVAKDDEHGEIRCPFDSGAYIVMPTKLPVAGEEAWLWGLPKRAPSPRIASES